MKTKQATEGIFVHSFKILASSSDRQLPTVVTQKLDHTTAPIYTV